MPDGTRGAVKGLLPEQVASTGVQVVLANTYHLHLQPGEKIIKDIGGLHEFGKWKGPILTDSGGFQVFSLSNLRKITEDGVYFRDPVKGDERFISPEKSMQIQFDLGSDMIVAFDHLIGLDNPSDKLVHEAYERTHRWLDRCIVEYNKLAKDMTKPPMLFGVVQGGLNPELRKKSLEFIQSRGVQGIAIGGLSVGETHEEMVTVLEQLAPYYDPDRPRFLLGVGAPKDLRAAIENGIDMLDCVLPTRNARHATVWVEGDKSVHLTNSRFESDFGPVDNNCDCYSCSNGFSSSFLRHQFKVHEPLAGSLASMHNLRYLTRICESYRKTS
jgi:queuine tRNA-ribosyltransferase